MMNCPHCGFELNLNKTLLSTRELKVATALVYSEDKYKMLHLKLGFKYRESLANIASQIYKKLGINSREELKALWQNENYKFIQDGAAYDDRREGTM